MPFQRLSPVAVGLTKAALDWVSTALFAGQQVTFSCSIRDGMVQSIHEKVKQMYPQNPQVLRKKLNSFETNVLSIIAETAAREIYDLFEPQKDIGTPDVVDGADAFHTQAEEVKEETGLEEDRQSVHETDSSVSETQCCWLG